MLPTEYHITGQWRVFKGDLLQAWQQLTEHEIEETHGDLIAISNLIQQKSGEAKTVMDDKLSHIFERFETSTAISKPSAENIFII